MSETESLRKRFAASIMPNYGVPPVAIRRGQGCLVWDADGREYLDLIAGIAVSSLGHAHPAIVAAVSRQVATVAHTSNLFLHEREIELAERLLALLDVDGRVFFANSGTEANEAALKLTLRIQGPSRRPRGTCPPRASSAIPPARCWASTRSKAPSAGPGAGSRTRLKPSGPTS